MRVLVIGGSFVARSLVRCFGRAILNSYRVGNVCNVELDEVTTVSNEVSNDPLIIRR